MGDDCSIITFVKKDAADCVPKMQGFIYQVMKMDRSGRKSIDSFSDATNVSAYAKEAMEWAAAEGLIAGYHKNGVMVLDPKGSVTRAQVASVLMRFRGIPAPSPQVA